MSAIDFTDSIYDAQQGSQSAIKFIYDNTIQLFYKEVCAFMRDKYEADKAIRDAYIFIFDHLNSLEDNSRFLLWANEVCKNTCIARLKNAGVFDEAIPSVASNLGEILPAADYDSQINMNASMLTTHIQVCLEAILDSLPDNQRVCAVLWGEGYPIKSIARKLGLSTAAINYTLAYALGNITNSVSTLGDNGLPLFSMEPIPYFLWLLMNYYQYYQPEELVPGIEAAFPNIIRVLMPEEASIFEAEITYPADEETEGKVKHVSNVEDVASGESNAEESLNSDSDSYPDFDIDSKSDAADSDSSSVPINLVHAKSSAGSHDEGSALPDPESFIEDFENDSIFGSASNQPVESDIKVPEMDIYSPHGDEHFGESRNVSSAVASSNTSAVPENASATSASDLTADNSGDSIFENKLEHSNNADLHVDSSANDSQTESSTYIDSNTNENSKGHDKSDSQSFSNDAEGSYNSGISDAEVSNPAVDVLTNNSGNPDVSEASINSSDRDGVSSSLSDNKNSLDSSSDSNNSDSSSNLMNFNDTGGNGKKKTHTALIVILIILVVILCILGGFYLFAGNDAKESVNNALGMELFPLSESVTSEEFTTADTEEDETSETQSDEDQTEEEATESEITEVDTIETTAEESEAQETDITEATTQEVTAEETTAEETTTQAPVNSNSYDVVISTEWNGALGLHYSPNDGVEGGYTSIPQGTRVTIDQEQNGWGHTWYNGMEGWIWLGNTYRVN